MFPFGRHLYKGNSLTSGYKLWLQISANIKHTQNKDEHEAWLRVWGLVALKSAKVFHLLVSPR